MGRILKLNLNNGVMRQPAFKRYVQFIWYRSLAEIRADISRSFLGLAWWIVEPLLYMSSFYLVFGYIFHQRGEGYVPFLLCGLVTWKWFASSVQNASTSITRSMALIYQVYLPKVVFPIIAILGSTKRFIFVFIILLSFLLLSGLPVTSAWFVDLPILVLVHFFLILGVGMTLAAIVPFVPDLKFIIDNGLLLLFFMSGIFFRFDAIPVSLLPYFKINPMAVIIHGYREILINGHHIQWLTMLPTLVICLFFLTTGWTLLYRWDRIYAKKAFL
jgi:lipopolysaccharide transport system permease protein